MNNDVILPESLLGKWVCDTQQSEIAPGLARASMSRTYYEFYPDGTFYASLVAARGKYLFADGRVETVLESLGDWKVGGSFGSFTFDEEKSTLTSVGTSNFAAVFVPASSERGVQILEAAWAKPKRITLQEITELIIEFLKQKLGRDDIYEDSILRDGGLNVAPNDISFIPNRVTELMSQRFRAGLIPDQTVDLSTCKTVWELAALFYYLAADE